MNAQAVKRFVEENQRLAEECKRLLSDCSKWERECSLYDHDREALMDFGNEADERAKEAEIRVQELEVELGKVLDELNFYKHRDETCGVIKMLSFLQNLLLLVSFKLVSLVSYNLVWSEYIVCFFCFMSVLPEVMETEIQSLKVN